MTAEERLAYETGFQDGQRIERGYWWESLDFDGIGQFDGESPPDVACKIAKILRLTKGQSRQVGSESHKCPER